MTTEKRFNLLEKCGNILGAVFFVAFAVRFLSDFRWNHRVSSLLTVFMVSVIAFFFVTRERPKQVSLSLYDWFIALYGTLLTLLLRPSPGFHESIVLTLVQVLGLSVSIGGLLSLNKSFGIVAANRGVKTFGVYRCVRHPIYAGYFLNIGAFCVQHLTLWNVLVFISWMTFELLRVFAEETYLSRDPVYAEYKRKVRWRILPFVF